MSQQNNTNNYRHVRPSSHKKKNRTLIGGVLAVAAIACIIVASVYACTRQEDEPKGEPMAAGHTREEISEFIAAIDTEELLAGRKLTLTSEIGSIEAPIGTLVKADADATASAVMLYADDNEDDGLVTLSDVYNALATGEIPLSVKMDEAAVTALVEKAEQSFSVLHEAGGYEILGDLLVIKRGKDAKKLGNTQELSDSISAAASAMQTAEIPVTLEEAEAPLIDLQAIYDELYIAPVEAAYVRVSSKEISVSEETPGRDFDLEAATARYDGSEEEISLTMRTLTPEKTKAGLESVLFRDRLSKGETTLSNVRDRTNNVQLASDAITGTILLPGEVFSFNETVGPRTVERGYREAKIFVKGEMVDGIGGGICQVSSNTYMAVIDANLEVVERKNHRFIVPYAPLGQDATVAWNSVDFKFKNSSEYPVKLIVQREKLQSRTEIYGTAVGDQGKTSYEYYTDISKTIEFETQITEDPLLDYGTTKVTESGRPGYVLELYRKVYVNGEYTGTEWVNSSSYKPLTRTETIGTNGAPVLSEPAVTDPGSEPVTDPATDPGTEPVTEPVTEPEDGEGDDTGDTETGADGDTATQG